MSQTLLVHLEKIAADSSALQELLEAILRDDKVDLWTASPLVTALKRHKMAKAKEQVLQLEQAVSRLSPDFLSLSIAFDANKGIWLDSLLNYSVREDIQELQHQLALFQEQLESRLEQVRQAQKGQ